MVPLLPQQSPDPRRGRSHVMERCLVGALAVLWIGFLWSSRAKNRGAGSGRDELAPRAHSNAGRWQLLTGASRGRLGLAKLVISLKFAVPSLMLWFPFVGAWSNYILDIVDGDILLELGLSDETYQSIDKAADYFSYVIMLIVGLRWRIRRLVGMLFVYRSIGQGLFFLTRNEIVFLYFPNFLEPLVLAYTFLIFRSDGIESRAYTSYRKHLILIWSIITIYKIWNEWYLHLANIDLSQRLFGLTGGARARVQRPSPT